MPNPPTEPPPTGADPTDGALTEPPTTEADSVAGPVVEVSAAWSPGTSAQAADLPTGIVTFPLTDLGGSTALWDRNPETMRPALARHDALVNEAVGGTAARSSGPRV